MELPPGREPHPPRLGPHLVGRRVVVRRRLPEGTGPSGGPALTDVVGVLVTWSAGVATVRNAAGQVTPVPIADIVAGKPVPPPVRTRVRPLEAERRACATWPAPVSVPLGEWLLRAAAGFSSRANSAMAVGDPGIPLADAAEAVRDFYRQHALPALAQVVAGSPVSSALADAGWAAARPGKADTAFQLASVSRTLRTLRVGLPAVVPAVTTATTAGTAWLASDSRALAHGAAARAVLEGPDRVVFASVGDPAAARGRAALAGDWVGISDVWVSPGHRRRGLARTVLLTLLEWAAEYGASTAFLQVRGDNRAAAALYERIGFATAHCYRYLTVGGPSAVPEGERAVVSGR